MSRYTEKPQQVLGDGDGIQLKKVEYYLPSSPLQEGQQNQQQNENENSNSTVAVGRYDFCVRSHVQEKPEHGCDAAELCVFFRPHGQEKPSHLGFVSQYRPPLDAHCIEFCAGLIDEGETPEQGALRELMEETGIADGNCGAKVKVLRVSPPIAYEPGLTSSCCAFAEVVVELPEGTSPQQFSQDIKAHTELEKDEQSLQMHVLSLENLNEELISLKESLGKKTIIDGKVWSYAAARSSPF